MSGVSRSRILATGLLAGLAVLLALTGGAPAQAQSRSPDSASCRRSCNAPLRGEVMSQPTAIQACLIRCQAQERYFRQEGRRGSASASGLGVTPFAPRPPVPGPAFAAVPSHVPSAVPSPVPSIYAPNLSQHARVGAIYAGLPPNAGVGLSVGLIDRIAAHRGAEMECMNVNGGGPCTLLAETAERCAAVGQLVQRASGAIVITSDPHTYRITGFAYGTGQTDADAEQAALNDCRRRDARSLCRIAASRCSMR